MSYRMMGGDFVNVSVSRLFHVASLIAFGAGFLGATLFGHAGLELVSGGLFLYAAGDVAEGVLEG